MNVKEKFIQLTSKTYPHGHEQELFDLLPSYLKQDEFGNLYHQIGDNPTTMFTSHLDTASYDYSVVNHVVKDNIIYSDGSTILGADDKAGVVILIYMMEYNIPGLYYFFLGEERGCIGSRKLSAVHQNKPISGIKKVVSFDRRGTDSVITHQVGGRCCSQDFAKELSHQLNSVSKNLFNKPFCYEPDSTGIYTDSAQFTNIYSECTNISVGYQNEHTKYESQDIEHLDKLCRVVTLINWDEIQSYRNPSKYDYDDHDDLDYGFGYSGYSRYSYNNDYYEKHFTEKEDSRSIVVLDTEYYGYESDIQYNLDTLEITKVKLHPSRLANEKLKISNLLDSLEVDYDELTWDGNIVCIKQDKLQDITMRRDDLIEYIPTLNDWIVTEIKYENNYGL